IQIVQIFSRVPDRVRPFVSSFLWFTSKQLAHLEEARIALDLFSAFYTAIDRVQKRLLAALGVTLPARTKPSDIRLDDGPVPPDKFRYQGNELIIQRPKVWNLISALWRAKRWTIAFDDLAQPVWGDHAKLVDESSLGSVRRDANNFFSENDIQLS